MQLHCGAAKEVDDPAEFRQNLTQVTQVRLPCSPPISFIFDSRGHESIIDLTITNCFGSDFIKKWKVDLSFSNSDNCYITFNEYLTINPTSDININNITTTKDLDTAATQLNEHLLKAFNDACPLTYISSITWGAM